MKRSKSAIPCEKGGLKMPRIEPFWNSLKISWSRRLISTNSLWLKLLQLDLLENNFDLFDIWYGGPSLLNKISDKLKNSFWKETLLAMSKIEKKIPCAQPHLFFHLNIFANDLFAVNKTQLLKTDFPQLWAKKLCQVGDFYDISVNPPKLLTRAEFNQKFNTTIDFLSFHRIRSGIVCGSEKMNHKTYNQDISDTATPPSDYT